MELGQGGHKRKRAPNTIGQKSKPINGGGGSPEVLFASVESMVAGNPKYF